MKTFFAAMLLTLAAFASAREFESYEKHLASAEDVGAEVEMPLFELLDENPNPNPKEDKKSKKKEDKKSKKKDDKKSKKKEDKKSKKKDDKKSKKKEDKKSKKKNKSSSSFSSSSSRSGDTSRRSDMCCDNPSDNEKEFCRILYENVCGDRNNPTPAQEDDCEDMGVEDCHDEYVKQNLRGNVAAE